MKRLIIIFVIILLIVLLFLAFLYFKVYNNNNNQNIYYSYDKATQEYLSEEAESKIKPNGIFSLTSNYTGKNDLDEFYKNLKMLSDSIIKVSNNNSSQIDQRIKIINEEEMRNAIYEREKIGKKSIPKAIIDSQSFEDSLEYLKFYLTFSYDNVDFKFEVHLKNYQTYYIAEYEYIS